MKIVESWLREWTDPDLDTNALAHRLTMAGHEVDGLVIVGEGLEGVVVAEVLSVDEHPDADRLSVCSVTSGANPIEIVCGAPNVVAGMKTALAVPGVTLPNGIKLKKTKIRGAISGGMLCSAMELGLGDEADGILALPDAAPTGEALDRYLDMPDAVIDLNITPNRGDCFSVLGIARDVSALTGSALQDSSVVDVPAKIPDEHPVEIEVPEGCPNFAGRVIRNIDPSAPSPLWMCERLRRAGLRPIHPVVDVTNYVMLELGQPLHAYDLQRVSGPIRPRFAKAGECVTLLDEKAIDVNDDTLVISDDTGVIGLAGIMGGLSTAVGEKTVDVFFEAAFWPPNFMAGRARAYGLHTDASLRFERGVDPAGQARAVERATALLLEVAGGNAGPLVLHSAAAHQPERHEIHLRRDRLDRLLGVIIDEATVTGVLERLGLDVETVADGWRVIAPTYRFDLAIEVDLIEEVARVFGYDEIPAATAISATPLGPVTESRIETERAAATLVARDFQEVITYSFIDVRSDAQLTGARSQLVLSNPISADMSVMRGSLLPGIIMAAAGNVARQQERVRLFEFGKSFHGTPDDHSEVERIAAFVTGPLVPEQWGASARAVDFFDIKADAMAVLELSGVAGSVEFRACEHPALQPGQAAEIVREDAVIGILGKLHPGHAKTFDLKRDAFVFELDAHAALASAAPAAEPVSRFPSIRRDIAVVVDEGVSADELIRTVASAAPGVIASVRIFDIYQGPGIEAGLKSVALGLILQETSRTLTDVDADSAMTAAIQELQVKFAAELRD